MSKTSAKPLQASKEKNPAAVAMGKLGGPKGGRARADKLTPERRSEIAKLGNVARNKIVKQSQRSEIARRAAKARWLKKN